MVKFFNDKRGGWLKIVEAFVAILLITGIALVLLNKGYFRTEDISERVYKIERAILEEIELNENHRLKLLQAGNFDQDQPIVPITIQDLISNRLPNYLKCDSKICEMNKVCSMDYPEDIRAKDIYAQSITIAAETTIYDPRQLKLFCWVK